MRTRLDVPDVAENFARGRFEKFGELAVVIPGACDGAFVDSAFGGAEIWRVSRRDERLRAVEAHVALALLFGIIKRVRVKKAPDELTAHVFEAEFEMRVL